VTNEDTAGHGTQVAPYGSWASPIDVDLLTGTTRSLSEPWVDGDDVYWMESRAAESGRRTLVRHTADGATRELTPNPFAVATRSTSTAAGATP